MAQKGDLMTARPDIRVLDATIRDGGLVNNFMFTDDFINALYRANVKAGIDYMEFGYKASKELFDVNKFGKCCAAVLTLAVATPAFNALSPAAITVFLRIACTASSLDTSPFLAF